MNKYFLGLIAGIVSLPVSAIALPPVIAQTCANYWTNPQTGKQECLTVKSKPSFLYLGSISRISKSTRKKVIIKFYAEKNIAVVNGISKPAKQVITFSNGYRFENEIAIDCRNQVIAYKSEVVIFKGKTQSNEEYQTLEFEPINLKADSAETRTYNYICNGVIPKK